MSDLPFPQSFSRKQQDNLLAIKYDPPVRYIKFEFDKNSIGRLFNLPKGSILTFDSHLFVEDAFDVTTLYLGTKDSQDAIFYARNLVSPGILSIFNTGEISGIRTKQDLSIVIGYNGAPTKGRGWGILKYLIWSKL